MSVNILKYEGDVWRTADFLRGAGIKESDFPKFMMPYFALIMVESRLVRESNKIKENYGDKDVMLTTFRLNESGACGRI